jgi:hypothetical protein
MFQLKVTPELGKVQLWAVPDAHWWVALRSVEFDTMQTSLEGRKYDVLLQSASLAQYYSEPTNP